MMNRWKRPVFLLLLVALLAAAGCAGKAKAPQAVLAIEGSGVESPVEVTLEELQAMSEDLVEDDYFSINTYGTEEYFHFKGVWVWAVLEKKASMKEGASKASFVAEDGYTVTYTLEEVKRDDYMDQRNPDKKYKMILAWEENHQPYDISEGSPFRLVIGQKEPGDVNKPYWVRQVVKIVVE